MSRIKILLPLFVAGLMLLLVLPVLAADLTPGTCFKAPAWTCYASNTPTANPDGTTLAPWVTTSATDTLRLRQTIAISATALQQPGNLIVITCGGSVLAQNQCTYITYMYDRAGNETFRSTLGLPPVVGVDLPFPYVLGGIILAGLVLVVAGLLVRRRAHHVVP